MLLPDLLEIEMEISGNLDTTEAMREHLRNVGLRALRVASDVLNRGIEIDGIAALLGHGATTLGTYEGQASDAAWIIGYAANGRAPGDGAPGVECLVALRALKALPVTALSDVTRAEVLEMHEGAKAAEAYHLATLGG